MTRKELARSLMPHYPHLPLSVLQQVVDAIFDTMAESLIRGEPIQLNGFGNIGLRVTEARIGANPRNGEPMEMPKVVTPVFTPSKKLLDRM